MQISARILTQVVSVNSYQYTTAVRAFQGDTFSLYLQLVDLEQHPAGDGFFPVGLRYMPQSGALLTLTFRNIDGAKAFPRVATQPFAQDPSIWTTSLLTTDPLRGTTDILAKLQEGAVVRSFLLPAALLVDDGTGLC